MTYTIQATKEGWILHRAAGITQKFAKLSTAKMLIEETGGRLIVVDERGNEM